MSRQLTVSATLSTLAMAAMALAMWVSAPEGTAPRPATAHGSVLQVLLAS